MVDELANLIECLDVLGMLAESELNLGLLDYCVDPTQPVGLIDGQQIEALQCVVEITQRFAIGPAALRLLGCQDCIIDRFFCFVAAPEVQCQQFCDFVRAAVIKLLEASPTAP